MKTPTDHPNYQTAAQRLAGLQADLAAKELRRVDLRESLARRSTDPRSAAEKLAAGETVHVASAATMEDEILTLTAQIRTILQAIPLVRQRLAAAHAEASRLACEASRARHAEAVRHVVEAIIALATANAAEGAIRRDLEQAGFTVTLRPMGFANVGGIEEHSGAASYLLEAVEFGYLTRDEFAKLTGGKIPLPAPRVSPVELIAINAKAALASIAGWARIVMRRSFASPELTLAERETVVLPEARARELIAAGVASPSSELPTQAEIAAIRAQAAT